MFQKKYELINSLNNFEKKTLIKNEYLKYWIRRVKSKNFKDSYLIDNSFSYSAIKKKSALLLNKKLGSSLKLSDFKFINKYNKNIQFKMPTTIKMEVSSKIENLKRQLLIDNKKVTFTILVAPKKGGFVAFSHVGMLGFLPNTEYKKILNDFTNMFIVEEKEIYVTNAIKQNREKYLKTNCFYNFRLFWFVTVFKHLKINCIKKRFQKNSLKTNIVFLYYTTTI